MFLRNITNSNKAFEVFFLVLDNREIYHLPLRFETYLGFDLGSPFYLNTP